MGPAGPDANLAGLGGLNFAAGSRKINFCGMTVVEMSSFKCESMITPS